IKSVDGLLQKQQAARPEALAARAKALRRRIEIVAHWYAGGALFRLQKDTKDNSRRWAMMQDAATHWHAIARDYPDDPRAFVAAKDAAALIKNMAIDKAKAGERLTAKDFYEKYAEVLTTLLGRWGDQPDLEEWHGQLAEVRLMLRGSRTDLAGLQDILAAISGFGKTSKDSKRYMEHRFSALDSRLGLLVKKQEWDEVLQKSTDVTEELRSKFNGYTSAKSAEDLRVAFSEYAADAARMLKGIKEQDLSREQKELRQWGSLAALRSVVLLYDKSRRDKDDQALKQARDQVRAIETHEQWKGTAFADEATILKYLWGFELGEPGELEGLRAIMNDKEKAEKLLPGIRKVRDDTRDEKVKPGIRGDKGEYIERYKELSRLAYERTEGQPKENAEKHSALLVYADALFEAGEADAALAKWQEAKAIDDLRVKKEGDLVDAKVDGLLRQLKDSSDSLDALAVLAKKCVDTFKEDKARAFGTAAAQLERYWPTARVDDVGTLAKAIEEACSEYRQLEKDTIAAEATVVEGLARTYRLAGRYADAKPLYERLMTVLGRPRSDSDRRYWSIQREYCECWLNVLKTDKEEMKRLSAYIKQIKAEGRDDFRDIVSRAQSLSQ
ncbi:MAG TPA: hypothetical protein VM098_02740, partial [Phycisphaerae bacterium]|nr:hypothetical protein [Phycisphaerae bacterium]